MKCAHICRVRLGLPRAPLAANRPEAEQTVVAVVALKCLTFPAFLFFALTISCVRHVACGLAASETGSESGPRNGALKTDRRKVFPDRTSSLMYTFATDVNGHCMHAASEVDPEASQCRSVKEMT